MGFTNKEKEEIISKALSTPEGRLALAQSMTSSISDALDLFGMDSLIFSSVEPTKEIAIECLSRYEINIANGKTYDEFIIKDINSIYEKWDIKKGEATRLLNQLKNDNKIKSRFDILDL